MQRITITPNDINPESLDVTRDGTRLGTICKDICNGRIQYGAWSRSPDHPRSFAGRYDSVEEAADAIAATWPTVEQPTEETPAQAAADTTPTRRGPRDGSRPVDSPRPRRFRRIRAAIARLLGHRTTATTAPEMEDTVTAMDYTSHTNQITADMQHAAALPLDQACGYMANYGAKLRRMADSYEHPDIAYRHLLDHADTAYDQATANN